ncbi:carbohydrate sulfotransferase 11-like [Antedon mediterranea]|uniref:carbohydrate sulfotransferase 11-like n=1 Tax=Antedon mediterranea TaxID=105859 RepID=UPI003AF98489
MLTIETSQSVYSPRFMIGCLGVLFLYCAFVVTFTTEIFDGDINLRTPDIRSANTFPWEHDDDRRVTRKTAKPQNVGTTQTKEVKRVVITKEPTQEQIYRFMAEQSEIQSERKENLAEICRRNSQLTRGGLTYDTLRHIYVHEKTKLLYCFVPKVACSNWKRVLMKLGGNEKPIDDISSHEAHFRNGMKRLVSYSVEAQNEKLKSYKKFMFARNPFTRILSAYKNKYQDPKMYAKETYFHRFAKRIMKKYRQNPSVHDLMTGEGITWQEFAQYLTDPSEYSSFDDHWEETYRICSPCKISYNFLGKLETINEDAKYILRSLNVSDTVTYPPRANSHPTNSTKEFDKYYGSLETSVLKRLWTIYRIDFELFGYEMPQVLVNRLQK